jgi:hypothetical protein
LKGWKKPNGNWVIELDTEEKEMSRLICVLSAGLRVYQEKRIKDPTAAISAQLLNDCLGEIVLVENYLKHNPPESDPICATAEDLTKSITNPISNENISFNELQQKMIKKAVSEHTLCDLL